VTFALRHHIDASVQEHGAVASVALPVSHQRSVSPFGLGARVTIMVTKSMSIILLLMTALLLGTIASIHAQSRLQPTSFDTAAG
jgi:hypothetical protein